MLFRSLVNSEAAVKGKLIPLASQGRLMAFLRQAEQQHMLVLANFGKEAIVYLASSEEGVTLEGGRTLFVTEGVVFSDSQVSLPGQSAVVMELPR